MRPVRLAHTLRPNAAARYLNPMRRDLPVIHRSGSSASNRFPKLRESSKEHPLRVVLVGIAGTSKDVLLAPATLMSYVLADPAVSEAVVVEVIHHKYMLPRNVPAESEVLAAEIAARQPDLVGFSTYCWNIEAVRRIAWSLRTTSPRTRILLGGPEIDGNDLSRGLYDEEPYDFLVVGEGETAFLGLLRTALDPALDGTRVPRLAFNGGGGFVFTPVSDYSVGLTDLKTMPSPFLTGAIPKALLKPGARMNIETQRGCNLRCAYCLYHANFPKIRYRDVEVVLDELAYIQSHGITDFRITDANFFSDHDFATALLKGMIARRFEMSLFVEVIPVFVDEEVAELMRQYRELSPRNQILVGVGLQTINEASLRAINRRVPVRHFDRAFDLLSKAGVIIKTDLILGLPLESKTTYLRLMDYISEKMRYGYNYLSLALLRLLPGTELKEIAEKYQLVADERDPDQHFVYETPDMPRDDLVLCARVSGVAFRLFHTNDDRARMQVRDMYFETRDYLGMSHIEMLEHFVGFFMEHLRGTRADFVQDDYPDIEHYWFFDIHKDVSDEVIVEELERMAQTHRRQLAV